MQRKKDLEVSSLRFPVFEMSTRTVFGTRHRPPTNDAQPTINQNKRNIHVNTHTHTHDQHNIRSSHRHQTKNSSAIIVRENKQKRQGEELEQGLLTRGTYCSACSEYTWAYFRCVRSTNLNLHITKWSACSKSQMSTRTKSTQDQFVDERPR